MSYWWYVIGVQSSIPIFIYFDSFLISFLSLFSHAFHYNQSLKANLSFRSSIKQQSASINHLIIILIIAQFLLLHIHTFTHTFPLPLLPFLSTSFFYITYSYILLFSCVSSIDRIHSKRKKINIFVCVCVRASIKYKERWICFQFYTFFFLLAFPVV